MDLSCLEADAASNLDPTTFGYASGGAGDSVVTNVAAWERLRLRPHMLGDVTHVSTATTLLGTPTKAPIMVAPTAMHRLFCPDGELATARAAAAAGIVYVVSMVATTSVEEIGAAAPAGARWMQAYVRRDRGLTRASLERAAAAGCQAVVLTVDSPGSHSPPPPAGRAGRTLNNGLPLPNLAPDEDAPDVLRVAADYATDLTFDDLADLRSWTGLPLVVKGILRGDDAARCIDAGADAIAVSNHGGRQLPGCVPTATALPEVVDALAGRGEVYVDGGVRSGADVLKALALGATAVMVGRPVLWGLAIGGETAAGGVLEELRANLERAMALCGVCEVGAVTRDLVCAV
ncbi:MAG: alpha-hydroxy acid oxidase [Acidimicrobiales bacterium]